MSYYNATVYGNLHSYSKIEEDFLLAKTPLEAGMTNLHELHAMLMDVFIDFVFEISHCLMMNK